MFVLVWHKEYLVSCVGDSPSQPSFAETVTAEGKKDEQWTRIKEAGAAQRNFMLFKDWAQYEKFLGDLKMSDKK